MQEWRRGIFDRNRYNEKVGELSSDQDLKKIEIERMNNLFGTNYYSSYTHYYYAAGGRPEFENAKFKGEINERVPVMDFAPNARPMPVPAAVPDAGGMAPQAGGEIYDEADGGQP